MKKLKSLPFPIVLFIFPIIALGLLLFLCIYWYIELSSGLEELVRRFNLDPRLILQSPTWFVILVLSILVGVILICLFIIFVYYLKMHDLYRLQNNFINNFTHELKTPVTSLKLYLETFLKHKITFEEQNKYFGYMIKDADRLSDNINGILNLGRIENKNYDGEFIITDIVGLTRQFIKTNNQLFRYIKIKMDNFPTNKYMYKIVPFLFEMMLMNLITNAFKYNKSEHPEIHIMFELNKKNLLIHFTDNGIGIEKNDLEKIFEKFYKVNRSDNLTTKGSGLGLYLVQNIVRLHKWKIEAESLGIGHGTTMNLISPLPIKIF